MTGQAYRDFVPPADATGAVAQLYTDIAAGHFEAEFHLRHPQRPTLLGYPVGSLSNKDLTKVPAMRDKFYADVETYDKAFRDWQTRRDELTAEFKKAALAAVGLGAYPQAEAILNLIWPNLDCDSKEQGPALSLLKQIADVLHQEVISDP